MLKFLLNTRMIKIILMQILMKNSNKKRKIMTVFDDMLSNKKLQSIVLPLFIRGRKLNLSLIFITQSYFAAPKNIRLN